LGFNEAPNRNAAIRTGIMDYWLTQSFSGYLSQHMNELIVIGIVVCALFIIIVYLTFFRRHREPGIQQLIETQFLEKTRNLPTKEEILNAIVEFDRYPSFIRILTAVLNQFTMDYLYSYGELVKAFSTLVDFPKSAPGISAAHRAAMITMVRVFTSSDFISQKCGEVLDENFDRFMDEASAS